jgi:hypothetical protein
MVRDLDMGNLDHLPDLLGCQLAAPFHRKLGRTTEAGQVQEDEKKMLTPELINALLDFRKARNWEQFHTARNVASALSVEAAELLEHFVWSSD